MKHKIVFEFELIQTAMCLRNNFYCSPEGFTRMSELFENYLDMRDILLKAGATTHKCKELHEWYKKELKK